MTVASARANLESVDRGVTAVFPTIMISAMLDVGKYGRSNYDDVKKSIWPRG